MSTFKPGESVKNSGVYRVIRDRNHVTPHEVTCVASEPFPRCNHCGPHPRFEIVRLAKHTKYHEVQEGELT